MLLTQLDKLLLSKLLTLQHYGYYALATTAANLLFMVVTPVSQAFYPRFAELLTQGDAPALVRSYHKAAQFVTVLTGSTAFVLIVCSETVLRLWTRDAALVEQTAPLLSVLAFGTLLNCLLWIPHQMQVAHGITHLAVKTNVIAIVLVVPALLIVTPRYGALGAAWVWVALNVGYLVFNAHLMYRQILAGERWRWYVQDVAMPLLSLAVMGVLCRWGMPSGKGPAVDLAVLAVTMGLLVLASSLAAPAIREYFRSLWPTIPTLSS